MTKQFIIPIIEMDASWCLRGFSHYNYAKEYCFNVLKVPLNHIKMSKLSALGLELELKNIENRIDEEWYINLLRVSK